MIQGEKDLDPQDLLPEALRHKWTVLPKALLYQLFLVGALLGAGVSISAYGLVLKDERAWWGFPAALCIAMLQNKLLPWDKRAIAQFQRHWTQEKA